MQLSQIYMSHNIYQIGLQRSFISPASIIPPGPSRRRQVVSTQVHHTVSSCRVHHAGSPLRKIRVSFESHKELVHSGSLTIYQRSIYLQSRFDQQHVLYTVNSSNSLQVAVCRQLALRSMYAVFSTVFTHKTRVLCPAHIIKTIIGRSLNAERGGRSTKLL